MFLQAFLRTAEKGSEQEGQNHIGFLLSWSPKKTETWHFAMPQSQ